MNIQDRKTQWKAWATKFPAKADASATPKPFVVRNSGPQPEILLYDEIGVDFWGQGTSAKMFADALSEIPADKKPLIRINSPGGNVWDGLAIYNLAKARGVDTIVDGVAASAASFVALAGDKVTVPESSIMMIHEAWGIAMGNKRDMIDMAASLEIHDETIKNIYETETGLSRDQLEKMMQDETWMDGRAALALGFSTDLTADTVSAVETTAENKSATNNKETTMNTTTEAAVGTTAEVQAPLNIAIENLGNPAIERMNSMLNGADKAQFVRDNYATLFRELGGIKNSNTTDSGLANTILAGDAIAAMGSYLAPLKAFSRQVALSPLSKRQTVLVPLVSSSGTVQTDPTDFETGDSTFDPISVAVNQLSKSFYVSAAEANLGLALAQNAPVHAQILAEGMTAAVTALMTADNYGTPTAIGAAASFTADGLKPILALAKNYRRATLLLDGGHLAYLLPTATTSFMFGDVGAYGFDGGIYKNNLWTGAATNTAGFICGPDAIAIATGVPSNLPNGEFLTQESFAVTNGITVTATTWFSRSSRSLWGSFDVMFGAAVGDPTQAAVLVTASGS